MNITMLARASCVDPSFHRPSGPGYMYQARPSHTGTRDSVQLYYRNYRLAKVRFVKKALEIRYGVQNLAHEICYTNRELHVESANACRAACPTPPPNAYITYQ